MPDLGIKNTETTVKINVVQVGQDKTFVEVSSVEDLLSKIGGEGRRVTCKGQELKPGDKLPPADSSVFVAPRAVKQGF